MKKAFDQTVRDLKRGVNKKVLKVPGIEQKVLDATSNEPWGPHGTLLAEIAQASRNYHEYQMIMAVVWKRINDTGKNWRHVYKGLTVLEYLVANGSDRVIDDIREHAYQISTLADFQYIDSSGRDQGSNVRRKSQGLVVLVNDKERIAEVRQKAAANRDKFRNTSAGGMYRPGSYSGSGGYGDRYEDDRYDGRNGGRDEDRNGYGRERDYNYRDDDRYGRYSDTNSRDGDRYGRDYEDPYSRDGYRDDDYRGRSRSIDGYGSRGRSADVVRDHTFDDDGQTSSRGSGAGRADDHSLDGSIARRLERKFSEQNLGAPPSYEEAVTDSRSPAYSDRNGESRTAPSSSSPPAPTSSPPVPKAASPPASTASSPTVLKDASGHCTSPAVPEVADEFDPRSSISAAPTASTPPVASNNAEMDLLGSLSDVFAPNPLAIMPATPANSADVHTNSETSFSAAHSISSVVSQSFDDPFGDSPFKAFPTTDTVSPQQPASAAAASFQPAVNQTTELHQDSTHNFGEAFSADVQPPTSNTQFLPQELSSSSGEIDILAGILPPSGPSPTLTSLSGFSAPTGQPVHSGPNPYGNFNPQMGPPPVPSNMGVQQFNGGNFNPPMGSAPMPSNMGVQQFNGGNFLPQGGLAPPAPSNIPQTPATAVAPYNNGANSLHQVASTITGASQMIYAPTGQVPQVNSGNFLPQQGPATPTTSQVPYQNPTGTAAHGNDACGNLFSAGPDVSTPSQLLTSTGALAIVPQQSKEKFETKSTVWADTLSRGLVNLNISGPKTNPLADIGVDFDAINRKEKRMEKQAPTTAVTSTVTMGKAMGSGSGMGRAGAGALRPPPNPMMSSGMGMGMGMGAGSGMGMGGYGGMNQPMGMGMGQPMGMNMGMNMGMAHGGQMQTPGGMRPMMPGGYNPMMGGGAGGYNPQQPYGGYQ